MTWNFNISEAPRGRDEIQTRTIKGEKQEYEVFVPERILAANKDGKVYATHWLKPNKFTPTGRWAGWSEHDVPVAWMHYPLHPHHMPPAELLPVSADAIPIIDDVGGC